jgi:hypothetical protein
MLQVAMFNAINALSGNLYSPYPSNLKLTPHPGTSPEIAAVYAAHRILSRIYVNLTMTFNTNSPKSDYRSLIPLNPP